MKTNNFLKFKTLVEYCKISQFNGVNIFFFLCFIVGGFFVFGVGGASAATYYMRADGTASNKMEATACSSAANAMSIATHNSQIFTSDDIIYLCNDGGDYTSILIPPSSGTDGHQITYENVPNEVVTFSGSSAQSILFSGTKNYITISGLIFANTGANNILANGSITGVVINNNFFLTLAR